MAGPAPRPLLQPYRYHVPEVLNCLTFNCAKVKVTFADLDKLKDDVMNDKLPETEGFFFGESDPERMLEDLEFIKKAKELMKAGYREMQRIIVEEEPVKRKPLRRS